MVDVDSAWASLRAFQSRLVGRLVRFASGGKSDRASLLSQQRQNTAAFLEADLRYILTVIPMVLDVPGSDLDTINETAHKFLTSLDAVVNDGLFDPVGEGRRGISTATNDIADLSLYPRLGHMLTFVDTSCSRFNLVTGQERTLFWLPDGQKIDDLTNCIAQMKQLLDRLVMNSGKETSQLNEPPEQSNPQATVHERYASAVVDRIFAETRHGPCGRRHEIKLKVPDALQTDKWQTPLDMFLSCCLDENGWHQARCGHFAAIYLSVDDQGLLDISDTMPLTLASATGFTAETLQGMLQEGTLTRITPGDYLTGTAVKKFSSRAKAILALSLARCLMEFFEDDVELASHTWKPDTIYFLRQQRRDRSLYISLRPKLQASNIVSPSKAIGPGNPILLSFAKLLLEIDNGESIDMEIHSESSANLPTWGGMCDLVDKVEREGGGSYLQAVEGCLYLHMALRKCQDKSPNTVRQTIRDQIVRNLELVVDPQSSKRKRRDSVSELPIAKKLSFSQRDIQNPPESGRPVNRKDFEVAIVCALPLEFDAVCALVDEFYDHDYGRANGDINMYTNARIGKTNVVLLLLSNMGKATAASTCASLRSSYSRLNLVLVTGICGGVPFSANGEELLLGDVVISRHIVQYDFGRRYPDEFETKDTVEDSIGRAPKSVRNLLALLQTNVGREKLESSTARYLQDIQSRPSKKFRKGQYKYPGASKDRLFQPGYTHKRHLSTTVLEATKASICTHIKSSVETCDGIGCDNKQLVHRERIELKLQQEADGQIQASQAPSIFVGTIGSGDTVMKSGEERDRIASLHNLLAFEMEGAGVWDEIPCIVVKGICDYADSHKNKNWQSFAAATAASAMKALLGWYIQRDQGA
ncbi:hypothetical protein BDV18DRAFT_168144 [Aspergillus unguis]